MSILTHFTVPTIAYDISALSLRLLVGFTFIAEARKKGKNLRKFSKNDGVPLPMAFFIMMAELCGGVALILGFLTQYAAAGFVILMLNTISIHIFKWKSPYWAYKAGWEYDLMLLVMSLAILVHGGGKFVVLN